jgi:hypothetical protein
MRSDTIDGGLAAVQVSFAMDLLSESAVLGASVKHSFGRTLSRVGMSPAVDVSSARLGPHWNRRIFRQKANQN